MGKKCSKKGKATKDNVGLSRKKSNDVIAGLRPKHLSNLSNDGYRYAINNNSVFMGITDIKFNGNDVWLINSKTGKEFFISKQKFNILSLMGNIVDLSQLKPQ